MGQTRGQDALQIDAHVGRRLRQLRQERGLSLAELAQLMGHTTGQAVSKYEHGSAFPAALMFTTAAALDVPIAAFFEGLAGPAAPRGGVSEPAEAFVPAALEDTTEARKIANLLRQTRTSQHGLILRVVKAIAATSHPETDAG